GGANRFPRELARDVGQSAKLIGSDVAERQRDGHDKIAGLLLLPGIGLGPASERRIGAGSGPFTDATQRKLLLLIGIPYVFGPAWIVRQGLAFFEDQFLEFLDAEILNQEFDARAGAILFLAEPREDAGHRLRQRKNLFHRDEGIELLGLIRHGAQPAASVD